MQARSRSEPRLRSLFIGLLLSTRGVAVVPVLRAALPQPGEERGRGALRGRDDLDRLRTAALGGTCRRERVRHADDDCLRPVPGRPGLFATRLEEVLGYVEEAA